VVDAALPRDERLCPVAPRRAGAPPMVSDYIVHQESRWNVERIEEFFLPMDSEIILNIPNLLHRVQQRKGGTGLRCGR
jgi:hypothetical protein